MPSSRWTFPLAVLCALAAAGCSDAPATPATVHADSAGIDIARFDGPDQALSLQLSSRFTLGGKETEEESFNQLYDGLVHADADGDIYVLDSRAHRALVFDSTGRHLHTMGHEGGGPGEFNYALSFAVSPEGTAGIFDLAKRAIVRFGPAGEVLPELGAPTAYFGGAIHMEGDALIVPQSERDSAGVSDVLTRMTATGTATLARAPRPAGKSIRLESCGMSFTNMPPLFAPTLRWAARSGRVAVAASAEYEVRVVAGDSLLRVIRRAVAPLAATLAEAKREIGEAMTVRTEGGERRCASEEAAEQRGYAPVIPAIARLAIDPAGRLWVERGHVRGDPAAIDLYDDGGDYLGTLPAGTPFPTAFLSATRLATLSTDEFDVNRIVVQDFVIER